MTEIGTTATIMSLLALPLGPALALLPILGRHAQRHFLIVPELAPVARMSMPSH